ncbi:hypothetical protein SNEBB_001244 [Seison nebaliae]|nr:hypothetical protein SNEBB_001244 [Seison nebaliae]
MKNMEYQRNRWLLELKNVYPNAPEYECLKAIEKTRSLEAAMYWLKGKLNRRRSISMSSSSCSSDSSASTFNTLSDDDTSSSSDSKSSIRSSSNTTISTISDDEPLTSSSSGQSDTSDHGRHHKRHHRRFHPTSRHNLSYNKGERTSIHSRPSKSLQPDRLLDKSDHLDYGESTQEFPSKNSKSDEEGDGYVGNDVRFVEQYPIMENERREARTKRKYNFGLDGGRKYERESIAEMMPKSRKQYRMDNDDNNDGNENSGYLDDLMGHRHQFDNSFNRTNPKELEDDIDDDNMINITNDLGPYKSMSNSSSLDLEGSDDNMTNMNSETKSNDNDSLDSNKKIGNLRDDLEADDILLNGNDDDLISMDGDDDDDMGKNRRAQQLILNFLNDANIDELSLIPGTSVKKASSIVDVRPFHSINDVEEKLQNVRNIGNIQQLIVECKQLLRARAAVTKCIENCSSIARRITNLVNSLQDGILQGFDIKQPALLNPDLQLKPYQLIGLNWLRLMYKEKINAILADDMGLGKTVQTIAFLTHLIEMGTKGPFLIIVPSSTRDNWCREIDTWCGDKVLRYCGYYGTQDERRNLRYDIIQECKQSSDNSPCSLFNILLTTYNVVTSRNEDRQFLKNMKFCYVVFDEAHMLKNVTTQRYKTLMKINAERKLLLTGTPIQNNLTELMSLLYFVMPNIFGGDHTPDSVAKLFKFTHENSEYTRRRVDHAKQIMKPFVLRRVKSEVLSQMPDKIEHVEICDMTPTQKLLYRTTISAYHQGMRGDIGSVFMELRKASLHPLLLHSFISEGDEENFKMAWNQRREQQAELLGESLPSNKEKEHSTDILPSKNDGEKKSDGSVSGEVTSSETNIEKKVGDISTTSDDQEKKDPHVQSCRLRASIQDYYMAMTKKGLKTKDRFSSLSKKTSSRAQAERKRPSILADSKIGNENYRHISNSSNLNNSGGNNYFSLDISTGSYQEKQERKKGHLQNDVESLFDLTGTCELYPGAYPQSVCEKIAPYLVNQRVAQYKGAKELCHVVEDLMAMSDFEIHSILKEIPQLKLKYCLSRDRLMDSGKLKRLAELLQECHIKGERVLLFSQFVIMLDILEEYLKLKQHDADVKQMTDDDISDDPTQSQHLRNAYNYIRLDGSTPVGERQSLIDQFNTDNSISIFLLSTRAGGLGINLTTANVVILYDIDFNPYNDRQAEDRCHRMGQTRDVHVIRMIAKNTVEETMLQVQKNKLRLGDNITNTENEDEDISQLLKEAIRRMDK